MGLLGDEVVKLFLGNNTVSVSVGSLDHLLEDSVVGQFSQVLGNFSQVLKSDES